MLLALAAVPAAADGKLEANYRVTLAGLTIGNGSWTVDVGEDAYTMAASGKVTGLMSALSSGGGTAAARGSIAGTRITPQSYAISIQTEKDRHRADGAGRRGGAQPTVEPPLEPKGPGRRVPLTDAHKRGVLDPISAAIIPRGGGDGLGADACQRTLAVFDGKQRYDLAMSYKRTENVKVPKGYEGKAVVCRVMYQPIAGHEPERSSIKFLAETRDIEMSFVPMPGSRFLVMYRISIPTQIGTAVLEATRIRWSQRGASGARPEPSDVGRRVQSRRTRESD